MEATANTSTAFVWVQLILGFIAPLAAIWLTARTERSRKDREKSEQDKEEKREKEIKELKEMIGAVDKKVDRVDGELKVLQGTVDWMKRYDEQVQDDIKTLSKYHERNGKYVNQLAHVLMTLAEGMRDQHLDGNITAAVNSYREFEHTQMTEMIQNPPINATKYSASSKNQPGSLPPGSPSTQ